MTVEVSTTPLNSQLWLVSHTPVMKPGILSNGVYRSCVLTEGVEGGARFHNSLVSLAGGEAR